MQHLTKFHKFILSLVLFVIVFYKQDPGINCSIICLFIWILSYGNLRADKSRKTFWLLSVALVVSALAFAWYGDALSFLSLFLSVGALGIYTQEEKLDILMYPVLLLYSLTTFIGRIFFINKWLPYMGDSKHNLIKKIFAYVLIPAVFVALFIGIYAASSETFQSFFDKINLNVDFVIFGATLLAGFYFMFNYWFMMMPNVMTKWSGNINYSLYNKQPFKPTFSFLDIDFERKSGEITLFLLNILLVFFIITYNYEIFGNHNTAGNLSDEVHARINTTIFSIVMAIGVIMFYFKSAFNFDRKAKLLKKLSVLWIILNGILIISATSKNTEYVMHLGLTFKRVGVYIFLSLSLIGLYFTYLKVKNQRSNWYLISRMLIVFFVTLIINCGINWSWIVTKYDLANSVKPDIDYLRTLDYNKQILYDYLSNNPAYKNEQAHIKEFTNYKKQDSFLSQALYYQSIKIQ